MTNRFPVSCSEATWPRNRVQPTKVNTSDAAITQKNATTRPGVDQIAQGMGGLMTITGEPGRGPMRVGIPIDDLTAGTLGVDTLDISTQAGATAAIDALGVPRLKILMSSSLPLLFL